MNFHKILFKGIQAISTYAFYTYAGLVVGTLVLYAIGLVTFVLLFCVSVTICHFQNRSISFFTLM